MLYLLRPPENSSGPQPRAREAERSAARRKETCSTFLSCFLSFLVFFFCFFFFTWWFTSPLTSPRTLLLFLLSALFDHFRPVTCFSCGGAVCERTTPHAGEQLVQQRKRKKEDGETTCRFCGSVKVFLFFFLFCFLTFFLTGTSCFSSQSFRHYYKLQGFESSVRRSGFSFLLFFFFLILLWRLGFLWHPDTRHKLILLRMYCMCVKWQSVSALCH